MCHQLHGDGQGYRGTTKLPAYQGAANQSHLTAAQKGVHSLVAYIMLRRSLTHCFYGGGPQFVKINMQLG